MLAQLPRPCPSPRPSRASFCGLGAARLPHAVDHLIEPALLLGRHHGEELVHSLAHATLPLVAVCVEECAPLFVGKGSHVVPKLIAKYVALRIRETFIGHLIAQLL